MRLVSFGLLLAFRISNDGTAAANIDGHPRLLWVRELIVNMPHHLFRPPPLRAGTFPSLRRSCARAPSPPCVALALPPLCDAALFSGMALGQGSRRRRSSVGASVGSGICHLPRRLSRPALPSEYTALDARRRACKQSFGQPPAADAWNPLPTISVGRCTPRLYIRQSVCCGALRPAGGLAGWYRCGGAGGRRS